MQPELHELVRWRDSEKGKEDELFGNRRVHLRRTHRCLRLQPAIEISIRDR